MINRSRAGGTRPGFQMRKMMMAAAAAMTTCASTQAATTFNGVTFSNVTIGTSIYDVTFLDGSFNSVFPTANLTFTNSADAAAAGNAIMAVPQFSVLAAAQSTSSFPGIEIPIYIISDTTIYNYIAGGTYNGGVFSASRTTNFSNFGYSYATFVRAGAASVPETPSWIMMIAGFGSIGFAMRSRRKAAITFA